MTNVKGYMTNDRGASVPVRFSDRGGILYTGRVLTLLRSNLAVIQASLGRHEEALKTASDILQRSSPHLLYTHFESLRCMAEVHLRRNELDEAERFCEQADELVSPTESRVSRL